MSGAESISNPYQSPTAVPEEVRVDGDHRSDFGDIIWRWERLRLVYNGFLTIVVLSLTVFEFPGHLGDVRFWGCLVCGAVIANMCFLMGPAIEGYGTYFRWWRPLFTVLLFAAGLGLAAFLAIACVVVYPTI